MPHATQTENSHRCHLGQLLSKGVPLAELTPIWHSKTWTLLHQLEAMLTHCKNDAQAPIFYDGDTITFTVPPQIHPQLNKVLFMSATANIEATQNAFDGKDVSWTIAQDKQPRLAAGVQMFQYTDSRMTAGSIFENERDASGNVIFDHDNKPTRTGKLTPRTAELLQKIAALVHTSPHKSAFIGYKEFVNGQFTDFPAIKKLHDAFDTVTHFDVAQGRNFDDYKIFVCSVIQRQRCTLLERSHVGNMHTIRSLCALITNMLPRPRSDTPARRGDSRSRVEKSVNSSQPIK